MELNWIEWYGYLASLTVFISLTMTSIIKLRVFNFVGCVIFAHYGLLVGSLPVAIANFSIALINLYFLYQIYRTKEQFNLVVAEVNSAYYQHFISCNQSDINKQVDLQLLQQVNTSFYMLRDNNIAGILAGNQNSNGELTILVDYVIPKYRDYKLADYYYNQHPHFLQEKGINVLKMDASDTEHQKFLQKMGFVMQQINGKQSYKKIL